jgi:hypothetical protein
MDTILTAKDAKFERRDYFGVRRQAKRDAALIIDPNRESKAPSLPAHSKVKSR